MVTATLYIEGGGEGKDLRSRFRKGWRAFSAKVEGAVRPSAASMNPTTEAAFESVVGAA